MKKNVNNDDTNIKNNNQNSDFFLIPFISDSKFSYNIFNLLLIFTFKLEGLSYFPLSALFYYIIKLTIFIIYLNLVTIALKF